MFIQGIMREVLKPVSGKYQSSQKEAEERNAESLYEELESSLIPIDTGDSALHGTTIFVSPGCSHNVRNGVHCGCSFCDWNDTYLADPAKVKVLREKDHDLYKQLQYKSLAILRGEGNSPKLMEEFALHDCFDDFQVTKDELDYLFMDKKIYSSLPYIGLVQVRAESITEDKISYWKKIVRKQLTLGVGVETGDEWLRNHWLNKSLSDDTLQKAIDTAHRMDCKVSLNLLISLPGLTDRQCVEIFIRSIEKLYEFGSDSIMISPLVRKTYTLQNLIYNCFKDKREYADRGIVHEDRSMDSLFIILDAIWAFKSRKNFLEKIMFSSLNFEDYFSEVGISDENKEIVSSLTRMLDIGAMKNYDSLFNTIEELRKSRQYIEYRDRYQRQDSYQDIHKTLRDIAHGAAYELYGNEKAEQELQKFEMELMNYGGSYDSEYEPQ
ncbi:MAG: Radical domain protein [Clostridia bacterium]|jgi:radical SAM enzyme (TIGR01210 family)|nr:Radical domain protein [Clostridia bacterium]